MKLNQSLINEVVKMEGSTQIGAPKSEPTRLDRMDQRLENLLNNFSNQIDCEEGLLNALNGSVPTEVSCDKDSIEPCSIIDKVMIKIELLEVEADRLQACVTRLREI